MSADRDYHLRELRIAQDTSHPSHILPSPLPPESTVLDIGCGAGQTLMAAYPRHRTFGIDPDLDALRLGKELAGSTGFVCGAAEYLPWRDATFDAVVSRVALPYTNLSLSLPEIARVLKPGGSLWMTLHPFSLLWKQAKDSNWKGRLFFAYVLVNSLLFEVGYKQFSVMRRSESFQTTRGITRALKKLGFENVIVTRGRHFLVTATRP